VSRKRIVMSHQQSFQCRFIARYGLCHEGIQVGLAESHWKSSVSDPRRM